MMQSQVRIIILYLFFRKILKQYSFNVGNKVYKLIYNCAFVWIDLYGDSSNREKAEAQKNRLLEYDRTSEKRTKVIDDESDYFSVDAYKWMTPEQKNKLKEREKELKERRHGSRLDRKIDFDFAGKYSFSNHASI